MIRRNRGDEQATEAKYPGVPMAMDGSAAVVEMETAASEGAGAYPITPSTQMGEGWAAAKAAGKTNVNGRRLLFFEPEGEHAAAGVTAGMSMTGLRATNFSSGQGIAYMHESLYAAVGKRLTYVLNVAARAMTKHALNVHAGHDDYHAVDDTGFFQVFAKDVQGIADLTVIAHRIAELSLNPGLVAQDGFLTSHVIESMRLPERELIKEYLGDPADMIESPTPAQMLTFGPKRRRIPEMFDLDYPALLGSVQNQDAYMQGVAAQRPFYFDHVRELTDRAMAEYGELTGRLYERTMGYRLDDAEYVLVGQGSVVSNAEAVADYLRAERGLKVGVMDVVMFRPFPSDLISAMLSGKKGVTVLERCDQPLAVDQPLLREIRAAMSQGQENYRASRTSKNGSRPFPGVADVAPDQVPDFYSAGFGFGSRDLQPMDLVIAVENMLPTGNRRRQYYLGIDFVREGTNLPKLEIWQEKLLEHYPDLAERALVPDTNINLLPEDAISLRIHSVGGWGAITMGKNVVMTANELAGLNVKANPKYGSEKKGQPTTFYGVMSRQPLKLNGELKFVNVVLSPDPNVFLNSNPLAGMQRGGVFVIQSDHEPEALWASLPPQARQLIQENDVEVYAVDAFKIATEEATDPDLRYRMQGTAFMGAFFRTSPFMTAEGLDEETLFEGMRKQLAKKFGHLGERVVDANLKVIRRGFDEVRAVNVEGELVAAGQVMAEAAVGQIPTLLDHPDQEWGIGNQGRFWEQVCSLCGIDQDVIADPFSAISAIPAATSTVRDMSDIRFEIPEFIASKCTGCAQCWTQCPDAAIPGLVNSVEDVIQTAIKTAQNGKPLDRIQSVSANLARETHKVLKAVPFQTFGDTVSAAYANLAEKLPWDAERKQALNEEFAAVYSVLSDFPLAKTVPFFDQHESKEKGAGGLLSITVNPEACKGCNICVDVCADGALVTVRQDEENLDLLRRNWKMWENLPDTADRFINIRNLEEGIGVLPALLLKKENYRTMAGGDGACMGCGEKTAVHLIVSTVESLMQPRVENFVVQLEELIETLDGQARELLSADADLDLAALAEGKSAEVPLDDEKRAQLQIYTDAIAALKDLLWRYTKGPSGQGRANMGISNSTGCSSVWGSTFPYNPYPYPWVNHLFQDSPSVAIGIFEGHMRKMQDAFVAVRRARLLASGEYDAAVHEPEFVAFTWHDFTDAEFDMCAPIVAIGGDGAMMDIGFQNLSRLLASGKPIRVIVLDTQVYSNTGGQACTSGFIGQVSDMAAYGQAQHGKEETRKELALIALAHRGAYVLQSSQASASHMIGGVIRGLKTHRPSIMNIYTPCPVEHGLADEWAPNAARFALEGRAFPFMIFDPDQGATIADCMDLSGNPDLDQTWPSYELEYVDESGETQKMELPVTTADWAATEGRFKKHFKRIKPADWGDEQVLFHEFLDLSEDDRLGKTPFIWVIDGEKKLGRLACSMEMVLLAEDRLLYWSQLKELAGLEVPASVRADIADDMEEEFEAKAAEIRAGYEAQLAELRMSYPALVARRMAEGLLSSGDGDLTVAEILARANADPNLEPITAESVAGLSRGLGVDPGGNGGATVTVAPAQTVTRAGALAEAAELAETTVVAPAPEAAPVEEDDDDDLVMDPYIETARCTSCDECININKKMFAYDENKQAYIKDKNAGTFAEIVQAAERCTAGIIHPGTPLNKKEKGLDKWIERAQPFN